MYSATDLLHLEHPTAQTSTALSFYVTKAPKISSLGQSCSRTSNLSFKRLYAMPKIVRRGTKSLARASLTSTLRMI